MFIPDMDLDFFYPSRIPDPGFKKAPDPGCGSATLILTEVVSVHINKYPVRQRILYRSDIGLRRDRQGKTLQPGLRICIDHKRFPWFPDVASLTRKLDKGPDSEAKYESSYTVYYRYLTF